LIAEVRVGARIMRALILRRVFLIEAGSGGPCLIGPADHPTVETTRLTHRIFELLGNSAAFGAKLTSVE
jgi:hypothetical protein